MNQNFKYNDGGRAASTIPNERLDCTVRAYALARSISYEESHSEFAGFGRQYSCCCKFAKFMSEIYPEFIHIETHKPRPRVKTFVKRNIHKAIVVRVKGHVFCIKDNVVLDTINEYQHCIITDIWVFD